MRTFVLRVYEVDGDGRPILPKLQGRISASDAPGASWAAIQDLLSMTYEHMREQVDICGDPFGQTEARVLPAEWTD